MGRKTYIALTVWFVLVVSCVIGAYIPLYYWTTLLSSWMPRGIQLMQVSGHWWSGQAQLSVLSFPQPFRLSWSMTSLFKPFEWQLNHSQAFGYGFFRSSQGRFSLWIEQLRVEPNLLNAILAPQGIHISGDVIDISRWYSVYDVDEAQFKTFQSHADWSLGRIRYQYGGRSIEQTIQNWQLQGMLSDGTQAGVPMVTLTSEQDRPLFEMKLLPVWEVELTVMPELIETMGLRWPGKKEYPAFVMVQPLESFWSH